jgi:hypothetical protein
LDFFRVGTQFRGKKRSFFIQIQKVNGVAPRPGKRTRISLKSSIRSVGPKFSASVPACIFFFSLFAGGTVSNRGNLIIHKTSGDIYLYIIILFVTWTEPNPAMGAAQLSPHHTQ